jgi:hypothetical protein
MSVHVLHPARSIWEAIGQGAERGMTASINQRIQDYQEEKTEKRQLAQKLDLGAKLAEGFGRKDLSLIMALDPKAGIKYMQEEKFSKAMREMAGEDGRRTSSNLEESLDKREPPPPFMLPEKEKPLEQPYESGVNNVTADSVQKKRDIVQKRFEKARQAAANPEQLEKLARERDRQLTRIDREANTASRLQTNQVTRLEKERGLRELSKPVMDRFIQYEDAEKRSGLTQKALENMTNILESGAQMPRIVTELNQKLGPDNLLTRFATALSTDESSPAIDSARLALLNEMTEIFGQVRVAQFMEYMKKLPSISDPEKANKIKIALLGQIAKGSALPMQGLKKAIKKDRSSPSDVILSRADKYTKQMTDKMYEVEDARLDYLVNPERYANHSPVMFPDGTFLIVPKENLKKALDNKGKILLWD